MNKRDLDLAWAAATNGAAKKKRKSRWGEASTEDKAFIPGMPAALPPGLPKDQEEQYIVQLQIEEISRRLRSGDLGIAPNPEDRSPSPEPIYNNEGKRLNTREYRTRKRLEEDRHRFVQRAMEMNLDYKPPADYKPPVVRVSDKVMIPQEEHPDINFVGLLIGPRGNTLKNLEKETGAKIIIRGKGSVKEGKIGRKDGQPLPGEDEPLHAYVTANNPENVRKAVDKIKDIIRQGIEVPEGQNDLRRQQLRELALLNGTLRENDGLAKLKQYQQAQTIVTNTIICSVCGGTGHIAQDCKQKRPGDSIRAMQNQTAADRAKMDSEYMSLMAELGEGPPPSKMEPVHSQHHQITPLSQAVHSRPSFQVQPPPQLMPSPQQPPQQPSSMWQQGPPRGPPPPLMQPLQGQPPPNSMRPAQPPPLMGGHPQLAPPPVSSMGNVPPHPWQQQAPPPMSSAPGAPTTTSAPTTSMGMPPPNLLAPPPPPPPTSQSQPPASSAAYPWQQPQQPVQNYNMPPPPGNPSMPPWQQPPSSLGPVPPPPPNMLPPWQQPPPMQQQPQQMSNAVAPPPPPPGSQPGNFNPVAPPPPPPGPGGDVIMGGVSGIPLGVPPPPPPI